MNMDDAQGMTPRERLVEVLLEETLRRPRDRHAFGVATSRARWLAAAIALLGVGVVLGVVAMRWQDANGTAPAQAPTQEPTPKPTQEPQSPRASWHGPAVPVASQADWDAVLRGQVTGVMFRLLRAKPDGSVEELEAGTDYVGVGSAPRDLAALVPPIGDAPFDAAAVETPPFDAYLGFETFGRRVHAFVRLWNRPTLVIGSRRTDVLPDAFQQEMQKMFLAAGRRLQVAHGVVSSLDDLAGVPASTKAIRCPPLPNGSLERHLGRFRQLEHLEFVFTTSLGSGQPISIQLPETPTTLFAEMKALPQLRHLRCSGLLLASDERAAELASLPSLRSLRIDGSVETRNAGVLGGKIGVRGGVTAAGMRVLAKKIEALELVDTDLSPALLEPWLEAAQLRQLVVFGDAMPPDLLARFARLPTLEELGLGGLAWTDAHLQALAGSRITRLRLERTKATSDGLRGLPKSLRLFDLRQQEFAESPYRRLENNLPECRILRRGDVDPTAADPFGGLGGATRR